MLKVERDRHERALQEAAEEKQELNDKLQAAQSKVRWTGFEGTGFEGTGFIGRDLMGWDLIGWDLMRRDLMAGFEWDRFRKDGM